MAPRTTKWRRSSPGSTSGLTIVELLVAIFIAMVVLGAALALTLSSRDVFNTDMSRTEVNQNLRGILEIVGNDIRIAGERLNSFGSSGLVSHPLAAVEVRNGNELILRRNMIDEILPLCQDVSGTVASLLISTTDTSVYGTVPQCNPDNAAVDSDDDGIPDALAEWRTFRTANGPEVGAYIYSRVDDKSDYFLYTGDPSNSEIGVSTTGLDSYTATERAVIVLVETRRYYLNGDVLELEINGDSENPMRLVNNVSQFAVEAVTKAADGSDVLHADYVASGNNWKGLSGVEISVTGNVQERGRDVERTLSSRYFPRNVLSN